MPVALSDFESHELQSQLKEMRRALSEERERNVKLSRLISQLQTIDNIVPTVPKWAKQAPKGGLHLVMPCMMLSDTHFDEVVRAEEVEGVNQFTRMIALSRLKRVTKAAIECARNDLKGLKYDGFTLFLGGDIFTGNIHEELVETNEDTILGSLDYWIDPLAGVIDALASEFGNLHVAGVVGNHGRNSRKPRAKLRARDNFDWFLYRLLARQFASNSRISFQIPESADCDVQIYETVIRFTHGDQFRGGAGISGMMAPIMLGHHRKSRRQTSMRKPFRYLAMGHHHQFWVGKGIIVNGTLKGTDEFAYVSNFDYERPQQAFWTIAPEQGLTWNAPLFAEDRDPVLLPR